MDFLPLFFKVSSSNALVFGSTDAAKRKIEVLTKAGCYVTWADASLVAKELLDSGLVTVVDKASDAHWSSVQFVVAAYGDRDSDDAIAKTAKARNLPVNVVNNAALSTFVFPSIIDRSPIIAAVSSSGELPVLTRLLRSRLESTIPHAFGRMASIATEYRGKVKNKFEHLNSRRRFWERHLEGRFADLIFSGEEAKARELIEHSLSQKSTNQNASGEVYLVGAGPGDPDLLTFKALRLIRQADIVFYDRLVSDDVMALVRQDAEKINVGKERSRHLVPQESINQLLVNHAKQGARVLRLKGGDPFIFGRGGEEIETLAEHNIPFQVVPGITAAAGCASYSGIPLTHRDYAQSVRFITGHLKDDSHDLPWAELIHDQQTLVFYMGLSALDTICRCLIDHGMSKDKPAALISKGTTRDQQVLTGTVGDLYEKFKQSSLKAPTIILVGDVVTLRDKLKWREES